MTSREVALERLAKANAVVREAPVQAWCYLCGSAHRHHEPCQGKARIVKPVVEPSATCYSCGKGFEPSSRLKSYCSIPCRDTGHNKRRRERQARAKEAVA